MAHQQRPSVSSHSRQVARAVTAILAENITMTNEAVKYWREYIDHASYHRGYRDGLESVRLHLENALTEYEESND